MKLYRCTAGHYVSHPQPRSEAVHDEDGPWHCPYPCMEDTHPAGNWGRQAKREKVPARGRAGAAQTTEGLSR